MKPIRSMLFVPGIKDTWMEKMRASKADAIILDLEDSVPENLKADARKIVESGIKTLSEHEQRVYVRINRGPYCYDIDDLHAVIRDGLEGIVIPKMYGPEDVDILESIVSEIEYKKGLEVGTTKFVATLETAESIQLAYEIGKKERVVALSGVSPKSGDVERALGYQWTPEGLERLYIRSRVVLAARATQTLAIGGTWQDVHNLEGLKESVTFNRQLGFMGEMIIHPSHIDIVNEAYSMSSEELEYYRGLVAAFEAGLKEGKAAVLYDGEHIDYAHYVTAKQHLETSEDSL
jgi:citrate lyase subunit beta/citryl-CoA lyase